MGGAEGISVEINGTDILMIILGRIHDPYNIVEEGIDNGGLE